MPEIIILGRVEYAPADRARYLAHIDELVVATRHEPGVRRYEIVADPHSATGVLVMEHYASSEGLEAHRSSAHLERFRSQTEGCVALSRDIQKFEARTVPVSG